MKSTETEGLLDIPEPAGGYVRIPMAELERIREELRRVQNLNPLIRLLHQQMTSLCMRYKEHA